MRLTSTSFGEGEPIPETNAFAKIDPVRHFAFSENRNPGISWTDIPNECRSLVLLCLDHDVPTRPDDVNQEGRTVPASLPRADFFHWVIVDIPPSCDGIGEGESSQGVTERGKSNPPGPDGSRQGSNSFTDWFAGDSAMEGHYFGYDGPAPPFNDELIHHYEFRLLALDVPKLDVADGFTGPEVLGAAEGHVLAEASIAGTYTLNPDLRE